MILCSCLQTIFGSGKQIVGSRARGLKWFVGKAQVMVMLWSTEVEGGPVSNQRNGQQTACAWMHERLASLR